MSTLQYFQFRNAGELSNLRSNFVYSSLIACYCCSVIVRTYYIENAKRKIPGYSTQNEQLLQIQKFVFALESKFAGVIPVILRVRLL